MARSARSPPLRQPRAGAGVLASKPLMGEDIEMLEIRFATPCA